MERCLLSECGDRDYDISPKAIVESNYNGVTELAIVGTSFNQNTGTAYDGFFIKLDDLSGGNVSFAQTRYVNNNTYNEWFGSIALAGSNNGYIIGGLLGAGNAANNKEMMMRLNGNGTLDWFSQLQTSAGNLPLGVTGVVERNNTSGAYEYYGAAYTQNSMMVCKLDDNGNPFSQPASPYSEFKYYSSTGNPIETWAISLDNNPADANLGIHVFGTSRPLSGGALGDYFLTRACFNGASANCSTNYQNLGKLTVTSPATTPVNLALTSTGSAPYYCGNTAVGLSSLQQAVTVQCSMSGLPTSPYSGNNSRELPTGISENNLSENSNLSLYPNPSSNRTTISYNLASDGAVKIELYNNLGQLIQLLEEDKKAGGDYTLDVEMKNLNLESGIYFIKANLNGKSTTQKLLYTKN